MYQMSNINFEVHCDPKGWWRETIVVFKPIDDGHINVGIRNPEYVLDKIKVGMMSASDMDDAEFNVSLWGRPLTAKGLPDKRSDISGHVIGGVLGEDSIAKIGEALAPLNYLVPVGVNNEVVQVVVTPRMVTDELTRYLDNAVEARHRASGFTSTTEASSNS